MISHTFYFTIIYIFFFKLKKFCFNISNIYIWSYLNQSWTRNDPIKYKLIISQKMIIYNGICYAIQLGDRQTIQSFITTLNQTYLYPNTDLKNYLSYIKNCIITKIENILQILYQFILKIYLLIFCFFKIYLF